MARWPPRHLHNVVLLASNGQSASRDVSVRRVVKYLTVRCEAQLLCPRTNHVANLSTIMPKKRMCGLTSPLPSLASTAKTSPQQICDVDTKTRMHDSLRWSTASAPRLAHYPHDRRTRSVMIQRAACCMTAKTWRRLSCTARAERHRAGRADTWRSCRRDYK